MKVCQGRRKAQEAVSPPWPTECPPPCAGHDPDNPTQIELSEGTGFDNGTQPWTPVYWRQVWDEVAGAYKPIEYSLSADFSTLYAPVGDAVPSWEVNERIFLGQETVSVGDAFAAPALANVGEYTAWPDSKNSSVLWTTNGNVPAQGAAHITSYGGFFQLETRSSLENLQTLTQGSGSGTIYAEYFYDPHKVNI